MSSALELVALPGLPMVREDDDIAGLIAGVLKQADLMLRDGDVVVVAQKIVSKAEGRTVDIATVEPSAEAVELAREENAASRRKKEDPAHARPET